jgi:F-box protein 18 (helicase)
MKVTEEQKAIIFSSGNLRINAVAGSGKTTTIIEYAAQRPAPARILYLVFNRSVRTEAVKKFESRGLANVRVETAHSLAWRYVVAGKGIEIAKHGYSSHELVKILKLPKGSIRHGEFMIANHILKLVSMFCNSEKLKFSDVAYAEKLVDLQARSFFEQYRRVIYQHAERFMKKMDSGEIPVTHDYYLKKFHLSQPRLPYDYILFDEGQDASAAMLDIFLRQDAVKVIVGDSNQQIYSWRYAVNSLDKADFTTLQLSSSFRFGEAIADLAKQVLGYKTRFKSVEPFAIYGKGKSGKSYSKAIIARTNLGLLLKAIEYTTESPPDQKLYFEGNIQSYTYADDGASLHDVLHLYNRQRRLIRDPLIASMKDISELEEYIRGIDDAQLSMMLDIVREYGNAIPGLLRNIKSRHAERENADVIFSTVHRCKGMEYDAVHLVDDFITEARLDKVLGSRDAALHYDRLNEEINLLYVAVTRARQSLHIPESLLPSQYKPGAEVHVLQPAKVVMNPPVHESSELATISDPEYRLYLEECEREISKYDSDLYKVNLEIEEDTVSVQSTPSPWTEKQDNELLRFYEKGMLLKDIAHHFNRSNGAITSRIKLLSRQKSEQDRYGVK